MAESLGRSRTGLIEEVSLSSDEDGAAHIQCLARQEVPLEMWGAQFHEKLLRKLSANGSD